MNKILPRDLINLVHHYIDYKSPYNNVLCELKQKFLHDRLMKEIFYNRLTIYHKFVAREFLMIPRFKTLGYGDDDYAEIYSQGFMSKRSSSFPYFLGISKAL